LENLAHEIGGTYSDDPLKEYLSDIFTLGPNLAGLCAISVPAGTVASDTGTQLPVGLQILAPHMAESTLLRVAKAAEIPA
jgi:aspartyl-tRNA(Asn)/glutamyl-tRNA(Gln) amidotransferase subunit A